MKLDFDASQRTVLFWAALAFIGMGIYPPWGWVDPTYTRQKEEMPLFVAKWRFSGYDWLWHRSESSSQRIDWQQLGLQWLPLGVATGVALVLFKEPEPMKFAATERPLDAG